MKLYSCEKQTMKDEENGEYTTYSIRVGNDIINDVSTDKEFAEDLTDKLNRLKADPLHIHDILEDVL